LGSKTISVPSNTSAYATRDFNQVRGCNTLMEKTVRTSVSAPVLEFKDQQRRQPSAHPANTLLCPATMVRMSPGSAHYLVSVVKRIYNRLARANMHASTHTHRHACTHTRTHTRAHTHIHTHAHTYTHIYTMSECSSQTHTHTYTHTHIHHE